MSVFLCVPCLTVFVNCLVKQFAMFLGVVAILLLNVMDVFSVCGGALLDRPCMVFQRVCVLCLWSQWASKCSFHMFCLCFCMSEVISSFRSLRAESQVFALFMLFLLCDFAYYVFGQEPAVAMYLALWYVVLVCHQYDVCENFVGCVYAGGYSGLSESRLCVLCNLGPFCFLVVGKGQSVLL